MHKGWWRGAYVRVLPESCIDLEKRLRAITPVSYTLSSLIVLERNHFSDRARPCRHTSYRCFSWALTWRAEAGSDTLNSRVLRPSQSSPFDTVVPYFLSFLRLVQLVGSSQSLILAPDPSRCFAEGS